MNDEQKAAYITSLLEERRSCEKWGQTDRVNDIDAELAKLGQEAQPPAQRAVKRTPRPKETR